MVQGLRQEEPGVHEENEENGEYSWGRFLVWNLDCKETREKYMF